VPDARLDVLAKLAKSAKIIPTQLEFVDIAGLVRGASKGEGLGNQFLAVIREVDAVAYVLRCFENDDITHVEGRIDPTADAETVQRITREADEQLAPFRGRMPSDAYARSREACVDRLMREYARLPTITFD
jgi:hypothetical protein